MDKVVIDWKGPYGFDNALQAPAGDSRGVYVLTSRRRSGSEKLMRIGQTYDQAFYQRLNAYRMVVQASPRDWFVRFGAFASAQSRISRERLTDVENLLIFVYQPEFNKRGRNRYVGRDIEIVNRGRRGPIDAVIRSPD